MIVEKDSLPKKSGYRYTLVYETYKKWHFEHKNSLSNSAENNLLVYFKELMGRLKPSTVWSIWSMLKKTMSTKENVDISQFLNLKRTVTNNSKGYLPNKSEVLTWNDVEKFIKTAADYELSKLKIQDVEDLSGRYLVSIYNYKNDEARQFIIEGLFYEKVKQYISL